jgi:hypothetical protein
MASADTVMMMLRILMQQLAQLVLPSQTHGEMTGNRPNSPSQRHL